MAAGTRRPGAHLELVVRPLVMETRRRDVGDGVDVTSDDIKSHASGSFLVDWRDIGGDIDQVTINTIRTLTIDAVQAADSGHAGLPLGMAPVAYTLWTRFLRYDPVDPAWLNRDRFVLSAGHGSMLLYGLLHLAGVAASDRPDRPAVGLDDIRRFRQSGSVCPGHPEYGLTTGVETTTGPLGQGVGNSVGMAIAERWLEQRYNRPGATVFDYNVYALCSDGDMMEGVSAEAASLAGHLKLANLCWIYDDNSVTIEGEADQTFGEDVAQRFKAYGWATLDVEDANDCVSFAVAVETFLAIADRPTLIRVKSTIGYGAPHLQGTAKIHSDPLGPDEVRLTKRAYGWPEDAQFLVPEGVREHFTATLGARGATLRARWIDVFARLTTESPALADELTTMSRGGGVEALTGLIPTFPADHKGMATREASGKVLNAIAPHYPWLVGGAADLAPSTKTRLEFADAGDFQPGSYSGRNLHFGVREHAMGAIANGLAVSKLRPYVATFLIFSDYMRPPTRLAALMRLPVIYILSHDSIGLGQDGPTHQPIEQVAALRAIPNLLVLRPADANETAEAWRVILSTVDRPVCLILSRQALPTLDRSMFADARGVARGAYVLAGSESTPEVILMASGSEVALCLEARTRLREIGVEARVVSMPSWELFEAQAESYRHSVLPPHVTARVAVEAATPLGWDRYTGPTGAILAMRRFGASAPIRDLHRQFGFLVEDVVEAARAQRLSPGSKA